MSNSNALPNDKTETNNKTMWELVESSPSLWWLNLDFRKHPGNVLFISSIPFCAGAYFGFRKPTEKLEELVGSGMTASASNIVKVENELGTPLDVRRLGLRTAMRALHLATLGTVGTFGVLGATGFYLAGYRSMDEAVNCTRLWASSWRQSFENWLGVENRPSATHPEVIATRHMNEDEELNYLYEKYIRDPYEGKSSELKRKPTENKS